MKKIAFVLPEYAMPVPSIMGGAVEQLLDILIEENEKNEVFKFSIYLPYFSKEIVSKLKNFKFKHTNLVFIKRTFFINFFIRVINKLNRIFHNKKQFTTTYVRNVINDLNKNNFDKVIFEGNPLGLPKKLLKTYNRENIYLHLHSQYIDKENIFSVFGNLIGVSDFISNDWKFWLEEKKINNVCIQTLKNCIDETRFSKKITVKERDKIRECFGFEKTDFVVIFCGRIVSVKGIKELMQAVIECNNNIKLLLIGSPEFARKKKTQFLVEIENIVKANTEKIKFTGFVSNDEMYKYYQSADLQAIPSTYNEAAGLVVTEGVYSGLPQLVTNSGGIPEFIDKNGSIIIDRLKDVTKNLKKNILILSKDKDKCEKMGKANLNYSKNFVDIINIK